MPKRSSKPGKRLDINELAKLIVDQATNPQPEEEKTPEQQAAALLGRKGGLKGGKARAKSLTKKQRTDIAKKAAKARWSDRRI